MKIGILVHVAVFVSNLVACAMKIEYDILVCEKPISNFNKVDLTSYLDEKIQTRMPTFPMGLVISKSCYATMMVCYYPSLLQRKQSMHLMASKENASTTVFSSRHNWSSLTMPEVSPVAGSVGRV